jgi:8-oxo-dGTP diphosphatase
VKIKYKSVMISDVVRVGVACFVTSSLYPGSILMGKRLNSHGAGKFATPGGHLELGESWEHCAAREVLEETNLSIENLKFIHVTVK